MSYEKLKELLRNRSSVYLTGSGYNGCTLRIHTGIPLEVGKPPDNEVVTLINAYTVACFYPSAILIETRYLDYHLRSTLKALNDCLAHIGIKRKVYYSTSTGSIMYGMPRKEAIRLPHELWLNYEGKAQMVDGGVF